MGVFPRYMEEREEEMEMKIEDLCTAHFFEPPLQRTR